MTWYSNKYGQKGRCTRTSLTLAFCMYGAACLAPSRDYACALLWIVGTYDATYNVTVSGVYTVVVTYLGVDIYFPSETRGGSKNDLTVVPGTFSHSPWSVASVLLGIALCMPQTVTEVL